MAALISNRACRTPGGCGVFYVAADYRRQGVGRELLTVIEQAAASCFRELYLFTDTLEAAQFYQRQGYVAVSLPDVSHRKTLAGVSS
ncbi:GNAT family N-acetyltransferase [Dickeya oryzae]